MKKNGKKTFFSYNQWTISLLFWLVIGVAGLITAGDKRVKAVCFEITDKSTKSISDKEQDFISFQENQESIIYSKKSPESLKNVKESLIGSIRREKRFEKEEPLQIIGENGDINSYKITYHANGGSGNMPLSFLSEDGGCLAVNAFTKTGYSFTGWSLSEGGEAMFQDKGMVYPVSDMVLYAVWEVNKYPVILENGGEGASGFSDAVSYGSTVTINAGKKKGYYFNGWTINSGGISQSEASGAVLTFTMPDEEVHLSANWAVDSYSVVVSEGGLGATESLYAPYQSTVTIQAGTKEGYTFEGWEVENKDVVLADASNPITTFVMGTSDVKIKARWRINCYTITIANIDENEKQLKVNYKETVTIQAGNRNGYYFCGWETADNTVSLENPLDEEISFTMPAANVELYAVWKEITGIHADLNKSFYNQYNNSDYCRDDCYNIGKNIIITKDMLDVQIDFPDKNSVFAKKKDYIIEKDMISLLGENQIKIVLTAGNTGLYSIISVTGYSPELDAVMQELGVSKGDYSGFAAKVEQIKTEISNLNTDIEKYKQNLLTIQTLLAEAGTDTDLTGDLEEQLKNTQNAVKETVNRLQQKEEEFIKIKTVITEIKNILGISQEEDEEIKNLSDILKELQKEIEKIKKNEVIILEEINQIAEKLGIKENLSNPDDFTNHDFFKQLKEKVDTIKEELELYEETINQLKETFHIVNTGSLKSQLNEVINKIEQKLLYLEDLKDQIENQLKGDYGAENTEEMEQTEAIFAKIHALKTYANNLKQFYKTVKELLGLDASSTKEEVYQTISNLKDKTTEYDKFLTQIKTLLDSKGNENRLPVTGEQTKEELDYAYEKMQAIVNQLEFFKEILSFLLEKEDISIEDKEELKSLLEQIRKQKETTDQFLNSLKTLLSLDSKANLQEIYQTVSAMKDTMSEYWEYLSKVETLIQEEDKGYAASGSAIVTGSAVTGRLNHIYEKLSDMVKQQKHMSETIKQLLEKENILSNKTEELQKLLKEISDQKHQTDQYLKELKKLLDLEDSADYQKVINNVADMREQLKHYITIIEKLIKQLGISPIEGEQANLSEQLKMVLNKVLELINQLAEQTKKSEEAEQTINSLEQQVKTLIIEKKESESENSKLKTEVEKLKKEIAANPPNPTEPDSTNPTDSPDKPDSTISTDSIDSTDSDSSDSTDETDSANSLSPSNLSNIISLEKKNRLQQDKITELENYLQSKAKEIENFISERKQLLETISDKDKEIRQLKEQIALLTVQLTEKENRVKELEQIAADQKPIQDLLEKNQISYEQFVKILSESKNINNKKMEEKNQITKETAKEDKKETIKEIKSIRDNNKKESAVQKEKREDLKTASAESEETFLEIKEEQSNQNEELITDKESEESNTEQLKEEKIQEKKNFNWTILIIVILLLVLTGAAILVLCGKHNINHK